MLIHRWSSLTPSDYYTFVLHIFTFGPLFLLLLDHLLFLADLGFPFLEALLLTGQTSLFYREFWTPRWTRHIKSHNFQLQRLLLLYPQLDLVFYACNPSLFLFTLPFQCAFLGTQRLQVFLFASHDALFLAQDSVLLLCQSSQLLIQTLFIRNLFTDQGLQFSDFIVDLANGRCILCAPVFQLRTLLFQLVSLPSDLQLQVLHLVPLLNAFRTQFIALHGQLPDTVFNLLQVLVFTR